MNEKQIKQILNTDKWVSGWLKIGISKSAFDRIHRVYGGLNEAQIENSIFFGIKPDLYLSREKDYINLRMKLRHLDVEHEDLPRKDISYEKINWIIKMVEDYDISIRRACKILNFSTSSYYYERGCTSSEVLDKLDEIRKNNPAWGFDKCFKQIRSEGYTWNRKRVWRIYKNYGFVLWTRRIKQ